MIIICEPKEKKVLLEKLSPENGGCIGCPVFDRCGQYGSCEEALKQGIEWVIDKSKNCKGM